MKVDSGSDWMSINRAAANRAYDAGASAAFAAAMAETDGKSDDASGRADFTSMTRQELRDWMNEEIRSAVISGKSSTQIAAIARKNGMTTLSDDAARKVADGIINEQEAARISIDAL